MLTRGIAFVGVLVLAAEGPGPSSFGDVGRLVREHDAAAKVALSTVLARPHAFGLGSLSGLRGEITIVDGMAWLAYPPAQPGAPTKVVAATESTESAGFLVATHVDPTGWKKVPLPEGVGSTNLETVLPEAARRNGVKDAAFAFRIEGVLRAITLAVVDGHKVPPGPGTEASMDAANVLRTDADTPGTLVGFYSSAASSPFTHPGKHAHVHAVLPDKKASGHAKDFKLAPGATLLIQASPGS